MKDRILERILNLKEPMVLVTIVETKGSAPRHNGSKMLVGASGILEGTVGGGRGEYNGQLLAQEILKSREFTLMDVARLGDDPTAPLMICGGVNKLMLQYLEGTVLETYVEVAHQVQGGHGVLVRTDLGTGQSTIIPLDSAGVEGTFDDLIAPPDNLLILGGGYVGHAIYKLGHFLGFKVTVYDDREEFAGRDRFPDAESVGFGSYVELIGGYPFDDFSYVAIVTRGHLEDVNCLRACLSRRNRYLGLIGSHRKVRLVMEELRKEGFGEKILETVHAPIGLDIGAETPEEIAVSIMAEIIEEKHGKKNR